MRAPQEITANCRPMICKRSNWDSLSGEGSRGGVDPMFEHQVGRRCEAGTATGPPKRDQSAAIWSWGRAIKRRRIGKGPDVVSTFLQTAAIPPVSFDRDGRIAGWKVVLRGRRWRQVRGTICRDSGADGLEIGSSRWIIVALPAPVAVDGSTPSMVMACSCSG
jgi:hypothetical protein